MIINKDCNIISPYWGFRSTLVIERWHSDYDQWSKEVWKSNFRQYGQMEKQRWEESEKRRAEERRSEKRKSQKKEDAGVRKGRKVAKHCVFPMICGSGGSKSRLAKVAGAEPSGQMRDEELHTVVGRRTFGSQNVQTTQLRTTFGSWDVEKVNAVVARSRAALKTAGFGPLLDVQTVQMPFFVAGARGCAPCQKWTKREGILAFPRTMADLQRICKDAARVAGAVQETCSIDRSIDIDIDKDIEIYKDIDIDILQI